MSFALVIPTLNAGPDWINLLRSIDLQTVQPTFKILLDCYSTDETVPLAKKHGFKIEPIDPKCFNHGLTRQKGAELCSNVDYLIYMTQDAVPASPTSFSSLLMPFGSQQVAAVYGRQLPRCKATRLEAFARHHNYPKESMLKTLSDIPTLGVQTAFCSNSFAAWRKDLLEQIGGFESTDFGEDMLAAAKLLLKGWDIAYCSEATVIHSHPMTLKQEYHRARQIGRLHRNNPWLQKQFGKVIGAGRKYMLSQISFLIRNDPLDIPMAILSAFAKCMGFRIGLFSAFG